MKKLYLHNSSISGFSLIELMITICIFTILLATAIPNFQNLINNQKISAASSDFFSSINLTRAEAIKRGTRIDMVANDGVSWESGWTIFVDLNNNLKVDAGEKILMTHDETSKNFTITSKFTDSTKTYISFTGNGRSRTNASNQQPQAGTVSFTGTSFVKRVKINFLGRPRVCNPATDKKTCTD
jgi:type IV fimbrial biogenesis protein FimT